MARQAPVSYTHLVERLTHYLLEGLARLEAYNVKAAASEVDGRRQSGKTAADDNGIGLDLRFVVDFLSFHQLFELPALVGRRTPLYG